MTAWHPILSAHEYAPGEWIMVDPSAKPYAVVRALELAGERGYRVVTWAERSDDRELVGYWLTLRAACAAAHRHYLSQHGPAPFQGYGKPVWAGNDERGPRPSH